MEVRYGALQEPKPGSDADHCEDAFAYSDTSSVVAVCDGAGTAFESRRWARLLARGFVERPPFSGITSDLLEWTDFIAAQWSQEIPWDGLNVFQQQKARSGSAATLVGMQLTPPAGESASGTWHCVALGDSCLFQVSCGRLVKALPLSSSDEFNTRPPLLSTERDRNHKSISRVVNATGEWQEGDSFFLLTDAIAQWFLRESTRGTNPWGMLTALDEPRFRTFVHESQARQLMRKDDVTAFMIGLGVPLGTRDTPVPVPGLLPGQPERVPASPGRTPRPPGHRAPRPTPPAKDSRRPPALPPPGRRTEPRVPASGSGQGDGTARSGRFDPARDPEPPDRPDQAVRRRRTGLIAAGIAICLAIGIGLSVILSSSPPAPPVTPLVPPVMPEASNFAALLTNYPGSGGTYNAYLNALGNDVVSGNSTLVTKLAGLAGPPAGSFSSLGSVAWTAVAQSGRSRAELYVLVNQTLTVPQTDLVPYQCTTTKDPAKHTCYTTQSDAKTTSRFLLVHLFMTRQQQRWLVSNADIDLVSPASGALIPPGSTG